MQITVNDQQHQLATRISLSELLSHMNIPEAGTAIALNKNVIPRSHWPACQLNDGDLVMIIRATAGG